MPVAGGIPFLGFRVFPHHRRLRTTGKVRPLRRLRALARAFAQGHVSARQVRASVMALRGHALAGDTYHWRTSLVRKVSFRRSG